MLALERSKGSKFAAAAEALAAVTKRGLSSSAAAQEEE
jgi:hypothetical protein